MSKRILALSVFFVFPVIASAQIQDMGDYNLNTNTGEIWVDVTVTRGMTVSEVQAQTGPTGQFAGCYVPGRFKAESLVSLLGLQLNCGGGFNESCSDPELLEDAIRILGDTQDARLDETNDEKDVNPNGAGFVRGFNAGGTAIYISDQELVYRDGGAFHSDSNDFIDTNTSLFTDNGALNQGVMLICDAWPVVPLTSKVIDFEDVAPNTAAPVISDGYQVDGDAKAIQAQGNISVETTECANCDGLLDYTTSQTFTRANGEPFAFFGIDDETEGADTPLGNCFYFKDAVYVDYEDCGIFGTTTWGEKVLYQRGNTFNYPSTFGEEYDPGEGPWLNLESLTIQLRSVPTYDPDEDCVAPCKFSIDNVEVNDAVSIEIDYDPLSSTNEVNPTDTNPNDFIMVQITTTSEFSGAEVNHDTVRLGPLKAQHVSGPFTNNFDGDGDDDYIYGFNLSETGIQCIHSRVILTGETNDGRTFAASDAVVMHPDCFENLNVDLEPFDPDNKVYPNDNFPIQVMLQPTTFDNKSGGQTNYALTSQSDVRMGPKRGKAVAIEHYGSSQYLATFRMEDTGITCDDTTVEIVAARGFASSISDAEAVKAVPLIDPQDCGDEGCHP